MRLGPAGGRTHSSHPSSTGTKGPRTVRRLGHWEVVKALPRIQTSGYAYLDNQRPGFLGQEEGEMNVLLVAAAVLLGMATAITLKSVHRIGAAEVGLVNKKLGFKKLSDDNPVAFEGEAGYQAELLMPGLRLRVWPVYAVEKFPWVQVPAGEIGVVIAQVGEALPIGAKSAR